MSDGAGTWFEQNAVYEWLNDQGIEVEHKEVMSLLRKLSDYRIREYERGKSESARPEVVPIADDLPLTCRAVRGQLDMRVGEKVLAFATLHCPALWDADADRGRFKVTDTAVFARAVEQALNHEAEDGSTRLTRMLDGAIEEAINQGAEGVEEIGAA